MSSIKEKIAAARQKIKESKDRGGERENFWLSEGKPKQVRILPDVKDGKFLLNELPMIEVTVWNIPGATKDAVLDPESINAGSSPMRKLYDELRAENDPSHKALFKWFKPKTRWFMRLCERKLDTEQKLIEEEKLTPKWYYAPIDISEEILRLLDDEEYGLVIMDPVEGLDFTFEKTGKGINTEYSATVRRKPSPLHKSKSVIDAMLQELPSLEEKLQSMVLPEEQLEELLSKMDMSGANNKKDDDDDKPAKNSMKKRTMEKDEDIGGEKDEDEEEAPSAAKLRERMKERLNKK